MGSVRLADYFVTVGVGDTFVPQYDAPITRLQDVKLNKISFVPSVLDRFVLTDYPGTPLSQDVHLFCLPRGVLVTEEPELPTFFTFVLTGGDGARLYGSCLTFYEPLDQKLQTKLKSTMDQLLNTIDSESHLQTFNDLVSEMDYNDVDAEVDAEDAEVMSMAGNSHSAQTPINIALTSDVNGTDHSEASNTVTGQRRMSRSIAAVSSQQNARLKAKQKSGDSMISSGDANLAARAEPAAREFTIKRTLHITKSICILSHYALFSAFKTFLTELYRLSIMPSPLPLERYISNFMLEVPLPPPGRIQIQASIGERNILISRPPINELPLAEVPFEQLFQSLDLDNILTLFNCILVEKQILLVSKHYALLGNIATVLTSLIFPFYWHHVYIPLLPKNFLDFLSAPVPFIMGIHSELYYPRLVSHDVVVVNLDNNTIINENHGSPLPKLPERQRTKLRQKLATVSADYNPAGGKLLAHVDIAFTMAPAPDEIDDDDMPIGDKRGDGKDQGSTGFPTQQVRKAFFRFFVSLFMKYRSYIIKPQSATTARERQQSDPLTLYFKTDSFLKDQPEATRPFVKQFLQSQAFQQFLSTRIKSDTDYEIRFFDESIQAKMNRSLLTFHKKDTPFLSNKHFVAAKTFVALGPDTSGIPQGAIYTFETFPRLDPTLYAAPRDHASGNHHSASSSASTLSSAAGQSGSTASSSVPTPGAADIAGSWKTIIATLASLSTTYSIKSSDKRIKHIRDQLSAATISTAPAGPQKRNSITIHSNSQSESNKDRSERKSQDDLTTATVSFAGAPVFIVQTPSLSDQQFRNFTFDTRDRCPSCSYELKDSDIRSGWSTSVHDYRTVCPKCGSKFVARFTVIFGDSCDAQPASTSAIADPTMVSNNGKGAVVVEKVTNARPPSVSLTGAAQQTPRSFMTRALSKSNSASTGVTQQYLLSQKHRCKYEYLSPLILKKEVENLLQKNVIADEKLFHDHPMMFWNLIVHFRDLKIPLNFLLPQVDWSLVMQTIAEQTVRKLEEDEGFVHVEDQSGEIQIDLNNNSYNTQPVILRSVPTEAVTFSAPQAQSTTIVQAATMSATTTTANTQSDDEDDLPSQPVNIVDQSSTADINATYSDWS